jgi:hypothetical protein
VYAILKCPVEKQGRINPPSIKFVLEMYKEKDPMKSWPLIRTIGCTKYMDFSPSIENRVKI